MFRSNFFYKFFKTKNNTNNGIEKYNYNSKSDLKDKINNQILEINKKISENSQALLEAQIVRLKSSFSKSNNLIDKIGKNVYKTKLEDSINWHQKTIKELYFERKELQIILEKTKGIYWLNQIKRILTIILLGFLILLILFIFFSGFIIMIYLLPLIILIFSAYLLSTKRY